MIIRILYIFGLIFATLVAAQAQTSGDYLFSKWNGTKFVPEYKTTFPPSEHNHDSTYQQLTEGLTALTNSLTLDGDALIIGDSVGENVTLNPVTGTLSATSSITAASFSGDGSALTALNASNITSGLLSISRLNATGTASSSTYLRGDGAWASISTGLTIGSTAISGGTSGRILLSGTTLSELTLGTGVATALGTATGTGGGIVTMHGALGTPSSGTLTSCTGLPISSGVSGLGAGVATAAGYAVNGASGLLTYDMIGTSGFKLPLLDRTNTFSGATTFSSTLALSGVATQTIAGLTSASAGLILSNSTAATVGVQQFSPFIEFQGNGWKTTSTAGSQSVKQRVGVQPVQSTTSPTSVMVFQSNINGAGWGATSLSTCGITSAGEIIMGWNGTADQWVGFRDSGNVLIARQWGTDLMSWAAGKVEVLNEAGLGFGNVGLNSSDVYLYRDAANVLALRNSTSAQTLRVYGTTTGSKYLAIAHNGTNASLTDSATSCLIKWGSGSPEGVVTAPVGSLYLRTDGGASTTLYIKESGSGNTGWIAK